MRPIRENRKRVAGIPWSLIANGVCTLLGATASAMPRPLAYVTNNLSNNVSVIDTVTNAVVTTIPMASGPFGLAITSDSHLAYVATALFNSVSVVDLTANALSTPINAGTLPSGVAVTSDGRKAYVADTQCFTSPTEGTVSVIDTATRAVTAKITVGRNPIGIAITPNGARVFVTNFGTGSESNTVSAIDTASDTLVATIAVGTGPLDVAITPDGANAYVTNLGSNTVSVIDTATNAVSAPISVGRSPAGIAITPDGLFAYATNFSDGTVSIVDTTAKSVVSTVRVGVAPQGVAFTPDGRFAYVANRQSVDHPNPGDVSVIDTSLVFSDPSRAVVSTIRVGNNPVRVAIGIVDTPTDCALNCDGDGPVAPSDLLTMVEIALGHEPLAACTHADINLDEQLTSDEILIAVNTALNGCRTSPTPKPTVPRLPAVVVPTPGTLLADVTVVNPGMGRRAHQTIEIGSGEIIALADAGAPQTGAATSRFAGAYVLPGLIDMHVHYPPGLLTQDVRLFNLLHLMHGVTTVRDTGSFDRSIFATRRRVQAGEFPGPRIFACGNILDGAPPIWPGSCVVTNRDEARKCVDDQANDGSNCIKVYNNLSEESLAAIRDAARDRGLPVIGHIPLAVPIERAGIVDVQHLTGVPALEFPAAVKYLDWWVDAWRQLDEERIEFIVRTSKEQGIAHTVTLVVWDRIARSIVDYTGQLADPVTQLLPHYYGVSSQWAWNPNVSRFTSCLKPETIANIPGVIGKMKELVRRLHAAGVTIHVGTDTQNPFVVPGASMHEELHNLVDAGFTIEEAWIAATREAGAGLDEPTLGTIQAGAPADLLVFREDPTADLGALATLEAIVTQGRLYVADDLATAAAQYRDYLERVYGGAFERLAETPGDEHEYFFERGGANGEDASDSGMPSHRNVR